MVVSHKKNVSLIYKKKFQNIKKNFFNLNNLQKLKRLYQK